MASDNERRFNHHFYHSSDFNFAALMFGAGILLAGIGVCNQSCKNNPEHVAPIRCDQCESEQKSVMIEQAVKNAADMSVGFQARGVIVGKKASHP